MTPQRACRYEPLARAPLVLVLCEVRFSPVRAMATYVPALQEHFRRTGFPLDRSGRVHTLTVGPAGIQTEERQRWEFRTRDEKWSVLITESSFVLQTTAYERFESFAERLAASVQAVFATTEHDKLGVVERIGLRYVDLVQPREGEDHRFYLQPGLHGLANGGFLPGSQRMHLITTGDTRVGEGEGTMIVRITQNDQAMDVPPDLIDSSPKLEHRSSPGELVTVIDVDHFITGEFEPRAEPVVAQAYLLHDHIIETFHEHIVTKEGVDVWKVG